MKPSDQSALKLQKILSKKLGRKLSYEETEIAYDKLMNYGSLLLDMSPKPELMGLRELVESMVHSLYLN